MNTDCVTIRGREESGYGVCIDSAEGWVVAVNNAGPASDPKEFIHFGRHPNTDETFVLVRGKGCIACAPADKPEDFTVIPLEQGTCYNIRRYVWHVILMAPGAKVIICENRNPGSEHHDLSPEARARLTAEAGAALTGE